MKTCAPDPSDTSRPSAGENQCQAAPNRGRSPRSNRFGTAHDSRVIDSTILDTTGPGAAATTSSALLAAVADPIRWRVVQHLAKGQACVCELQEIVPIAANLLSYHLRILREARLVVAKPRGRWVDYELSSDAEYMLRAALPFSDVP